MGNGYIMNSKIIMKKRLSIIIVMTLFAWVFPKGFVWYRQFTEKHYVPYLNYWRLDGISSEFYPMAYVIFNHKEDWDSVVKQLTSVNSFLLRLKRL